MLSLKWEREPHQGIRHALEGGIPGGVKTGHQVKVEILGVSRATEALPRKSASFPLLHKGSSQLPHLPGEQTGPGLMRRSCLQEEVSLGAGVWWEGELRRVLLTSPPRCRLHLLVPVGTDFLHPGDLPPCPAPPPRVVPGLPGLCRLLGPGPGSIPPAGEVVAQK